MQRLRDDELNADIKILDNEASAECKKVIKKKMER